jgi:hypothetical protein
VVSFDFCLCFVRECVKLWEDGCERKVDGGLVRSDADVE